MANEITLSAALRSNLNSLQKNQGLLELTQNRLATGKKVNSALDDPTAFFAAQGLSQRAGDLSRLLDGIGQSIQVLKAADAGISSLTTLVAQAQSIAETARDQASGAAVGTSADIVAADQADLTANAGIAANDSFSLQAGTTNPVTTFKITSGMSLADLAAQINATSGFSAQIVAGTSTSVTTNRRLEIRTTNGESLIKANVTNTPLTALGGTITAGTTAASSGVPVDRVQLEADYNEIRTQIDQLITDTGYRGTNLLNGDSLSVQFNEDNSSKLTVAGTTFDTSGLSISAASFGTDNNIQSSLDELSAALDTLRSQARTFGGQLSTIQTREDFTKNLVSTLEEGSNKLTLADLNEEGAKLLSLQTAQQLGITSLSLAAQAQQSVLRLF